MPSFAASVAERTTSVIRTSVVRADGKSGRLVRSVAVQVRSVAVQARSVAVQPREVTPVSVDRTASPASAGRVPADPTELIATSELISMIDAIAAEQGVEDALVHSVIRAESNYNARAVSVKGAQGIMQLIPATARRFGVNNIFDPRENVLGGVKYLKFLLDYYANDYVRAIAAYNAGEAAVDKYNGIPPFAETRNYVYTVARNLKTARERQTAAPTPPAAAETYRRIEASVGLDGKVYFRTP